MKTKLTASALLTLLIFCTAFAQSDLGKFRYQPGKVKTGAVYHYVKTNIDGTHPERVSVYVAARDRIESFKFHPKGERAALVVAEMDWSLFTARKLESWQVRAGGEKALFASMQYNDESRMVEVSILPQGRLGEKTAIKYLPFHVYNFDLASLNFAFRHLVNPLKSFRTGLADPTFQDRGPLFRYRGEVDISYVGEEIRNNARCRKYRILGKGLEDRGGFLWVDRAGGYFQDVEIELADNPDWNSFKFLLKSIEQMTRDEWESFIKAQF